MFNLVLIFDCTYKTNRYQLPLLDIFGVRLTKLTLSIGVSYLEHEREANFTWALEKLQELFTFEKFLRKVMEMDQEVGLINSIEVVF